jgi:uncharacterized protein YraI
MRKKTGVLLALMIVGIFVVGFSTGQALEFGTAWSGSFYNNTSFSGNVVATVNNINGLNFNWPGQPNVNGIVVSGVGENNFSARFGSSQTFSQATYQFSVTFDDNVRVLIDGQNVFEDFSGGPVKTRTFNRDMTAGVHTLTVDFVESTEAAVLQFQWFLGAGGGAATATTGPSPTPGPTNTPVPTGIPAIPAGAISATVIRAPVLNARSGPFLGAPRVARILRGQTYAVIGRNPQTDWFLLQLSSTQAWAWGYYLAINGNEFNVPIVSAFTTSGPPASNTGVVAVSHAVLKLRAAPTVASTQIGRVDWGAILPVIGKSADGVWWRVVWKNTEGWVYSPFVDVIQGNLNSVPIIQ